MSILNRIVEWSTELPNWQQTGMKLLFATPSLSEDETAFVYSEAKAEYGATSAPAPGGIRDRVALDPIKGMKQTDTVRVKAMKNLRNVNMLAEDQTLDFSPEGMTVIYGHNGTGKSGYSRVLKQACRARNQKEEILPNMQRDHAENSPATATIEVLINDTSTELCWRADASPPDHLSSIAVFDSHCARAYVDNDGDFAYIPYGLDLLHRLADLCGDIRKRAGKEKQQNAPDYSRHIDLENTNTKTGDLIRRLRTNATAQEIEHIVPLNPEESTELERLTTNLSGPELAKKAQHYHSMEMRLQKLKENTETAVAQLGATKIGRLRNAVADARQKTRASEIAARKFREQGDLLPGTGGSAWRHLFEAARKYAVESHIDYTLPESRCPLCQNPLGESGLDRLRKFDEYVSNKTAEESRVAQELKDTLVNQIRGMAGGIGLDDALVKDISGLNPTLAQLCKKFQDRIRARRTSALAVSETNEGWDEIPDFPANPCAQLAAAIAELIKNRKDIAAMIDSEGHKRAQERKIELATRQEAATRKNDLLELVRRRDLCASLDRCIESANSARISRKSTELSGSMAKEEVAEKLTEELKAVGIDNWRITIKSETRYGNPQFKLVLQSTTPVKPSTVLSEGEQRAVAIASFLAEVNLNPGTSGIVFDDPVSSLDHQRKEKVARRLLEEAGKRQVVVFTHDFAFMCLIGAHDNAGITQRRVIRGPKGFGTVIRAPEFSTLSTKKRIKLLQNICSEMKASGITGECPDGTNPVEVAFQKLRKTWEYAVEEVLFNGVIIRYTEEVHTKKLRAVTVCDGDFRAIDEGMTVSSKYSGHARADNLQPPAPSLPELEEQVQNLADWYERIKPRKEETEGRRADAANGPPPI